MRSLSAIGRVAAVGALVAAIVLVGLILFAGGGVGGYTVHARFLNAGQLVKGNPVQVGGVPVGSVKGIHITDDGAADITMSIDGDHAPLRRGTRAEIRQFSQSGLANRYVDLSLPPDSRRHDPGRRRHRHRQDRHPGRPRRALQHARRSHPEGAAGLLQGLRGPVAQHGRRGQRRLRVPEPRAVHLPPPVQRADEGHPAPPALPGRQLPDGHGARGAARRPRRPDRQPQRRRRARSAARRRRSPSRSGGSRRSCGAPTRPS